MDDAIMSGGVAFKLQEDGSWKPEQVPEGLPDHVKVSGYLTIDGYRCVVFEDPGGDMWAQKSSDVPVQDEQSPDIVAANVRILAAYVDSEKPSAKFVRLCLSQIINAVS